MRLRGGRGDGSHERFVETVGNLLVIILFLIIAWLGGWFG